MTSRPWVRQGMLRQSVHNMCDTSPQVTYPGSAFFAGDSCHTVTAPPTNPIPATIASPVASTGGAMPPQQLSSRPR
jgi:hypothetical protein